MQRRSDAVMTSAESEHLGRQPPPFREMQDFLKKIVKDSEDSRSKSNSPTSLFFYVLVVKTALRLHPPPPGLRHTLQLSVRPSPCPQIIITVVMFNKSPGLYLMHPDRGMSVDLLLIQCDVWTSSVKQAALCLLQGRTSPPTAARANRPLRRRPARCPALPTAWSVPGPPGRRVPTAVPPRPRRAARAARGPCWRSLGKVRPRTLKFLSIFFLFVFAA